MTGEIPETCAGSSWLRSGGPEYRITERLLHTYNVAVEHDGAKAIFSYTENNPNRPTNDQIAAGPIEREYYTIGGCDGDRERSGGVDEETKRRLREAAESFMRSGDETYTDVVGVEGDVIERLSDLGYR